MMNVLTFTARSPSVNDHGDVDVCRSLIRLPGRERHRLVKR